MEEIDQTMISWMCDGLDLSVLRLHMDEAHFAC